VAKTISRDELKQAIDAGEVTVVETLRDEHFQQGHLPGAIHIRYQAIAENLPKLLADEDAAIVTYCSNNGVSQLRDRRQRADRDGLRNVRKYAQSKQDWQGALALEVSAAA
jgi:rhodanese-related sulfurtransferase